MNISRAVLQCSEGKEIKQYVYFFLNFQNQAFVTSKLFFANEKTFFCQMFMFQYAFMYPQNLKANSIFKIFSFVYSKRISSKFCQENYISVKEQIRLFSFLNPSLSIYF